MSIDELTALRKENARLLEIVERCVMDKVRAGKSERAVRFELGLLTPAPHWAEDSERGAR